MAEKKNVLFVTNASTETEVELIKHAMKNQELNIKLNLVHVVPSLPTCYFNIPSMVILAERYYEEAKQSLRYIGDALNVAQRNQWLITGKIKTEVLRLAGKLNIHFILASSSSIHELQKAFTFKTDHHRAPIKSINPLGISLLCNNSDLV